MFQQSKQSLGETKQTAVWGTRLNKATTAKNTKNTVVQGVAQKNRPNQKTTWLRAATGDAVGGGFGVDSHCRLKTYLFHESYPP